MRNSTEDKEQSKHILNSCTGKPVAKSPALSNECWYMVNKSNQICSFEMNMMENFVKIVMENIDNKDLGVRLLLDRLGMSKSSFYSHFANITERNPIEVVRDIRMNFAKHLLIETELSLGEIGIMVGVTDMTYFSTLFHRYSGYSPSRFRRVWKMAIKPLHNDDTGILELVLSDAMTIRIRLSECLFQIQTARRTTDYVNGQTDPL